VWALQDSGLNPNKKQSYRNKSVTPVRIKAWALQDPDRLSK